MYLTKDEQRILDGEQGAVKAKLMHILVAMGDIYSADRLVPITSAHISGVSYKTIGDTGLDFLKDFTGGVKFAVKTTINPCGMDLINWKSQNIDENFAKKQIEIVELFKNTGALTSYTCTPYLYLNRPKFGDHISWGESSAVCFANSVIGARTNREGGPGALAAAAFGKTANYGFHLDEHRKADFLVNIKAKLKSPVDYGIVGRIVGSLTSGIPYFRGISISNTDEIMMKYLSAALAVGSIAMFQIEGVTPENNTDIKDRVDIDEKDMENFKKEYFSSGPGCPGSPGSTSGSGEVPDLIAYGCPHASIDEIREIASLVEGKKLPCDFWLCTSREAKKIADDENLTGIIEKSGGKVLCDTCMVVAPIEGFAGSVFTNSAKALYYLNTLCGAKTKMIYTGDLCK